MDLPNVSGVLEQLYTDRMTVRRYKEGLTDPDGAVLVELEPTPVLEEIPCRVSYSAKDSPQSSDDANPVSRRLTLFCRPEIPLQNGDFISVRRGETEAFVGRIGKPSRYGSSLQAQFQQEDTG